MDKRISYGIIILIVFVLIGFNMFSNSMKPKEAESSSGHGNSEGKKVLDATLIIKNVAVIETSKGNFEIAILKKDVPQHSNRFMKLVKAGKYKDDKFVKAESWVVQAGAIADDLKPLEIEKANGLDAARGAVGMARLVDEKSATSSFFVIKEISPSVAESYTIFGYVVKGMDVVDSLDKDDVITGSSLRKSNESDQKAIVALFKQGTQDRGTFERFKMQIDSAIQMKQMQDMARSSKPVPAPPK